MRGMTGPVFALALFSASPAALAQDASIAESTVHNGPVEYSTLLPLSYGTEGWTAITEGSVGTEAGAVAVDMMNEDAATVAFVPRGGNLACSHIDVTYDDMSSERIDLEREGILNELQIYEIGFGVDPARVSHLNLNCRAVSGDSVDIAVYGGPALHGGDGAG